MERWLPGIALFLGFLWIRSSARRIRDDKRLRKAIYAVFFLLAPFLILCRWGFDQLTFKPYVNLVIELAVIAAAFWAHIHFFLRPDPKE